MNVNLKTFLTGSFSMVFMLFLTGGFAMESEQVEKGKALFATYCAGCHGEAAVGQDPRHLNGGYDAKGNRIAPALNGTAHAWHHAPSLLYRYIQEGSVDETSPMPSFGGVLDDADTQAIIAYLQSLWPEDILEKYRERYGDTLR